MVTGDNKGAKHAHMGFRNGWVTGDSWSAKCTDIHMKCFEKNVLILSNKNRLFTEVWYKVWLAMIWDTDIFHRWFNGSQ